MKNITTIINESAPTVTEVPKTNEILGMLYKRYAEEILQWYHYWTVEKFMCGKSRPNIEKKFAEFADDELNDHADKILTRINELGGDIEIIKNINLLKDLSDCDYAMPLQPYNSTQLVLLNIEHEKCAITGYKQLCEISHEVDPVTYEMATDILSDEESHLRDLLDFANDADL